MNSSLNQDIETSYAQLIKAIHSVPISKRQIQMIEGTGGKVSLSDLIAYQIGWGKCLIRWYEDGIQGKQPQMPGDGFLKWEYVAIAHHFYRKYAYDGSDLQLKVFEETVAQILKIVQKEQETGNLHQPGVWSWCTLPSKKQWPLSKWIQVNTVSPYKRAAGLIKKIDWLSI